MAGTISPGTKLKECGGCGRKRLVQPYGPIKSNILLIGEYPGWEELRAGEPWVGRGGEVLRTELQRAGLTYRRCRVTNLWLHERDEDGCDVNWHLDHLMAELVDKELILLMGSDVLNIFLPGELVSDWNGLEILSPSLPKTTKVAVAMFNPAIALHDKLGEVRFALENFVEASREYL